MKIGFFVDLYYPHLNGVTVSVENLAKSLRKKGHTVYIIAPKVRNSSPKSKIVRSDVIYLPSTGVLFSAPEIRLPVLLPQNSLRKVLKLDLDIVHAHGNGAFSLLGYQIARARDIPFILTFHGLLTEYTHYIFKGKIIRPPMVKRILRLFGMISDGVVTPSEKMRKELLSYGLSKDITVLPNFVPLEKFNVENKNYLRKKLNLPKNDPIILTVGRLGKEKNFKFLVEMFKKLAKKEDSSHLVVVGDGPEKERLIKAAGSLVGKRIHFTGPIDPKYMPYVYKDADIFAFASVTEVHPMVALEAAAAGLPLILANDLAFKGLCQNGINGYYLPLKPEIFTEKIVKLLKNPKLREQFSKSSIEIVQKNFNPEIITLDIISYYLNSIKNHQINQRMYQIKRSTVRLIRVTQKLGRIINP